MISILSLIIALFLFLPVAYLLDLLRFKRDLKRYNSVYQLAQIPIPDKLKDLSRLMKLAGSSFIYNRFYQFYLEYYHDPEDFG